MANVSIEHFLAACQRLQNCDQIIVGFTPGSDEEPCLHSVTYDYSELGGLAVCELFVEHLNQILGAEHGQD
jgi:hypothetical protein